MLSWFSKILCQGLMTMFRNVNLWEKKHVKLSSDDASTLCPKLRPLASDVQYKVPESLLGYLLPLRAPAKLCYGCRGALGWPLPPWLPDYARDRGRPAGRDVCAHAETRKDEERRRALQHLMSALLATLRRRGHATSARTYCAAAVVSVAAPQLLQAFDTLWTSLCCGRATDEGSH